MRRRNIAMISLVMLLVAAVWGILDTRWGLVLSIRLASAVVPGEITVKTTQGTLLGPLHLREVHYQRDGVNVDIRQLDIAWALSGLLVGKLQVQDLQASGIRVALPKQQPSSTTTRITPLALPLAIELQHAHISDIKVQPAAASAVMIQSIALAATLKKDKLQIRQFQVHAYDGNLRTSGTARFTESLPLNLAIDFRYQPSAEKSFSGKGKLTGNLQKLQLSQTLSGAIKGRLQAQASNLLTGLTWQAKLALDHFALQRFVRGTPAINIAGQIQVNGNKKTAKTESTLKLDAGSMGKARLQIQADSDLALKHYQVTTQGSFNGANLPNAEFNLKAGGGRKNLAITQLDMQTMKGRVQGQAQIDWQKTFRVTGQLDLHQLDTAQLAADWPGRISAKLVLDTQRKGKTTPIHFSLQQISGQLRGHPVSGHADGVWTPQALSLKTVNLDIAGTKLSAQGELARRWDIHFQAKSDELAGLLPSAQGRLELTGVLSGSRRYPRLRLDGKVNQFVYAKRAIDSLDLKMDMGLAANARSFLQLQARNVQVGHAQWHSVELLVHGTNAQQTIRFEAKNKQAQLLTMLQGQFRPWRWQGRITQFDLDEADYGHWQLQQPVSLQLARRQYSLSSFCLAQKTAHLCLQGRWAGSQRQASLNVSAMPLPLLKPWLPSDIQLDGVLNAHARLDTATRGGLHGELTVSSPDKSVVVHFAKLKETLTLGASRLTAKLDDKGLDASLHIPVSAGGGIDSRLRLPNWSPLKGLPRAQPVAAELKLVRLPADVVTRLIPETARASGEFAANLHVSGTLGEPRLRGNAGWQGGSVQVPPLGINIHGVSAELSSAQSNIIKFIVRAKSGDGELQLDGQTKLDPANGWPTHATLTSHQLQVSNIPEAFIVVDSKLDIKLQGSAINTTGEITIPRARLRPSVLPTGAVPVSPDMVIVNANKQTTLGTRWQLTTHLQVRLGDEVDFKGFGISGKLRGNLVLNDEPGKLILGQGEISIADGTYRLRGQDLTIRRGRLIFSNTFIDDPALDVEAVRVVNTVTAGVRLKGTLKQPQLTVFSEPAMSQSDALAYLLLGHSLNQSTQVEGQSVSNATSALGLVAGNYLAKSIGGGLGLDELRVDVNQTTQSTSLVLGKYLSPKLYLRYYNGIAESSRMLQLQYQLSRRVQIQTESGYRGTQSVTGGDIFFTVEY